MLRTNYAWILVFSFYNHFCLQILYIVLPKISVFRQRFYLIFLLSVIKYRLIQSCWSVSVLCTFCWIAAASVLYCNYLCATFLSLLVPPSMVCTWKSVMYLDWLSPRLSSSGSDILNWLISQMECSSLWSSSTNERELYQSSCVDLRLSGLQCRK